MVALSGLVGLVGPNETVVLQNTQLPFLVGISGYPLQFVRINFDTIGVAGLTPLDHDGEELARDARQSGKLARERGKGLASFLDCLLIPTSILEEAVIFRQVRYPRFRDSLNEVSDICWIVAV